MVRVRRRAPGVPRVRRRATTTAAIVGTGVATINGPGRLDRDDLGRHRRPAGAGWAWPSRRRRSTRPREPAVGRWCSSPPTPGRPLYERLGFSVQTWYGRWKRRVSPRRVRCAGVATGAGDGRLVRPFRADRPRRDGRTRSDGHRRGPPAPARGLRQPGNDEGRDERRRSAMPASSSAPRGVAARRSCREPRMPACSCRPAAWPPVRTAVSVPGSCRPNERWCRAPRRGRLDGGMARAAPQPGRAARVATRRHLGAVQPRARLRPAGPATVDRSMAQQSCRSGRDGWGVVSSRTLRDAGRVICHPPVSGVISSHVVQARPSISAPRRRHRAARAGIQSADVRRSLGHPAGRRRPAQPRPGRPPTS